MFLICFPLGYDSSEGKQCCASRAYAVWPHIFGKAPLLLKKRFNAQPHRPKAEMLEQRRFGRKVQALNIITCIIEDRRTTSQPFLLKYNCKVKWITANDPYVWKNSNQ